MSDGRKKKEQDFVGPNVVTLDQEEFNRVCKKVHAFLLDRAEKAREKKENRPTKRSMQNHIEASKEVFVFVHLIELVENMTEEIADLRSIISQMNGEEGTIEEVVGTDDSPSPLSDVPEMFSTNKKQFIN